MKKILSLIVILAASSALYAYDFMQDSICYKRLGGDSVSVTFRRTGEPIYSGDITIPATVTYNNTTYRVTEIGTGAFSFSYVTSVTIPEGVTTIADQAFIGCSSLTSVTIPEGVTTIADQAFSSCRSLTAVTLPSTLTYIGIGAFSNCSALQAVVVPDAVTYLGNNAFQGSGLTSITLGSGLQTIGSSAFKDCQITSVHFPASLISIGNSAFYRCSALTDVTFETGSQDLSIEGNAFVLCTGITTLALPDNLTHMGMYAFSFCRGITTLTLPKNLKKTGQDVFEDCSAITALSFPDSVSEIEIAAFRGCSAVTSIEFGSGLTFISSNAFENDSAVQEITSHALVPPAVASAFQWMDTTSVVLYVPEESLDAYMAAEGWRSFYTILPIPASRLIDSEASDAAASARKVFREGRVLLLTADGVYDASGRRVE